MYPNRFQMENKCEFLNWRITAEINYVPLLFDLLQVPYLWFPQKWYSVRLYHQLLVGGLMYYCGVFFCVCMFAHSVVQHIVCCLFGLSSSCVFCLSWLPLRFSLTFIFINTLYANYCHVNLHLDWSHIWITTSSFTDINVDNFLNIPNLLISASRDRNVTMIT